MLKSIHIALSPFGVRVQPQNRNRTRRIGMCSASLASPEGR